MKVVKNKKGEIVYRSEPEFEPGKGKLNAQIINGGKLEDYEEVEITEEEWNNHVAKLNEAKNKKKQNKINAINKLKNVAGLTDDEVKSLLEE